MEAPTKGTFRLAGREFPRVTWYKDPGMRRNYIVLMFVVLTSATNGYDGSMVNGLQALDPWKEYFDYPKGSLLGLFSCIMAVGSLCALPITPYIADGLGRRMGILAGCCIMMLGVVLQSISINFRMFIAARFFLGFGVSIAHGASPLLITELTHPQHRAIFTTIYNTTWYVGSIIAAWLTFGTNQIGNNWSWRIPSIVQAAPSLVQIFFIWFVDESPRWYIRHGKEEKALEILARVHANGNADDEVVQLEMDEIKDTLRLEREFESSGWPELWRTPGNRHRLIILLTAGLFSQWSGNGLVSYYINLVLDGVGVTNSNTQLIINGILQICNAIVAITQCFFVDKVGRRVLFLISTAGMLCVFIVWTICSAQYDKTKSAGAGRAVIAMIFLYYVFYNVAWSGLLVGYCVEILPYNIRAKGLTMVFLMVNVALMFNQYVNPIALGNIGWKYYIVYCAWLGVELAVVWKFYIETRHTPLEEIAKHFDGESAMLGGAVASEKGRAFQVDHEDEKNDTRIEHREV
ncbi:High-affinity glucose transporter [Sphaceloma murrayae]|uniref:High-affinity glucose transporter n=1 Tax=Sphaceloma murrayae TaxID=2082308 RepID=A0A2K1QV74_9PEZI|nr:High-affinity glucose transporter [Sphaceloma murrayae]